MFGAEQVLSSGHSYYQAKRREENVNSVLLAWWKNVVNFLSIIHRFVCGQSRKVNDNLQAPDCEHLMSMFESSHKH